MLSGRSSSKTRKKSDMDTTQDLCEQMNGSSFTITSNGLLSIPRIHVDRSSASESSWTSNEGSNQDQQQHKLSDCETRKSSVSSNASAASASSAAVITPNRSQRPSRSSDAGVISDSGGGSKSNRKYWGEEAGDDSIYNVYLKKITYSGTDVTNGFGDLLTPNAVDEVDSGPKSGFAKDVFRRKSVGKSPKKKNSVSDELDRMTRSDQIGGPKNGSTEPKVTSVKNATQSLLWETRQIRILKAGTLDHILKYVLLSTQHQLEQQAAAASGLRSQCNAAVVEEERNNVMHVMHVLFLCYRTHCPPPELFLSLRSLSAKSPEATKQFNYVLHYWLNNYADDFFVVPSAKKSNNQNGSSKSNGATKHDADPNATFVKHEDPIDQRRVIDHLLAMSTIDDALFRRVEQLAAQYKPEPNLDSITNGSGYSKGSSSCVLELDARFVAQQLTAIDLENFLSLKAHTLLDGPRSNPKVQATIKNFNLLSRHVIVTILKSQSPDVVTSHWIEIALQLRRMKNFNSLKAVIAGLTNESIYRLKTTVWAKLNRQSQSNFKWLSTIVDDVNNQTLLRQTQLEIEGTAKVSLQEESFGTIPYLGTFFTDLTVIDSQFSNFLPSANNTKLINIDKWSKQFEIITQIQLLQKNVKAALTAVHQSQHLSGMSQLPTQNSTPIVPRVARLFRNWFQENAMTNLNDNDCYKLSLALEPPVRK